MPFLNVPNITLFPKPIFIHTNTTNSQYSVNKPTLIYVNSGIFFANNERLSNLNTIGTWT
ncbi:hypothetical protein BXY75_1524 [Ulvibacter antarcticus]|uniref:Uncharacterized protein n=2 Tax=Ulvibacter antarcticus TaxID=442714 RepID=A0A3L9YVF1_9FLAO|nr:hypothetical protein BXY75_1524 [Ulvibacter antarcticus]